MLSHDSRRCKHICEMFQVPGSWSHTLSFWSIETLYCQRLHFLWASNWGWNVNWCWSSFLAFSSDLRSHSDKAFQKSELNNKFVGNYNWYQHSTSVEFWLHISQTMTSPLQLVHIQTNVKTRLLEEFLIKIISHFFAIACLVRTIRPMSSFSVS